MATSLLEQVKIQAQVLIPLVRVLQAELGEERANALIRKSIGPLFRQYGQKWWQAQHSAEFTERLGNSFNWFAEGDALEYKVLKQTPAAFELNVTRCRYAEFYQALGAPELGFLLTCDADSSFVEGFGPEVELTRTKTIMQGFDHCDFRYKVKRLPGSQGAA
jgi:hypothetical protein